jgi:transposase
MVDIPSRRVIDIIETRETQAVKEWLKTFPSLRYVARDGSISYKSAITQANEKITQISDRFHLLKGLTDAAKKYITSYFKANIGLPVSSSHYDGTKTSFYWTKDTGNVDILTRQHICTSEKKLKLVEEAGGVSFEKIQRKWLISLLYKPIDKVKDISQEQLDKVIDNNPIIGKIYDIVKSFKEILFSKKEELLDSWIEQAFLLGIDEINSFIGGIKRDIDAVKNAVKYDFNNGLAEGSVNKPKVIKRIMYGRCTFYLLKNKLLHLESKRKIN